MLIISMPITYKMGDTAPARVDGKWTTLTWRDARTLVVGETDARRILDVHETFGVDQDGSPCRLLTFIAGDGAHVARDVRPPTLTITRPDAAGNPVPVTHANLPPDPEGTAPPLAVDPPMNRPARRR